MAGLVLPAVAALVSIPLLLRGMGAERFGVLALAWTLVGYFGVFDLGVGRALTQALAEAAGVGDEAESPRLTWSALWLLLPVGVCCGVAVAVAAGPATRWLRLTPALQPEAAAALFTVAAAVPFMVLTSGFRGVLEAGQQFKLLNALRVPLALLTFLGPLTVQRLGGGLPAAVAVLAAGRVAICALHWLAVVRSHADLRRPRAPRRADAARLWNVAGWMTVSSVISPVLVSADRFVIGAVLPVSAVAHYVTASEVASKLGLFPAAVQPVLFPALAATIRSDPARAAAMFDRAVRATALALAPVALLLVLFAREGLTLWVGPQVAAVATPLVQWLAVAAFVNALAAVPHTFLQSAGRADLPGKLHAVELPLYLVTLWALLDRFGLPGVAAAWLLRMLGDAFAQLAAVRRVVAAAAPAASRAAWLTAASASVLALCTAPASLGARGVTAAAGVGAFLALAPRLLLTCDERRTARAWARSRTGRRAAASA